MSSRRQGREIALQILYLLEWTKDMEVESAFRTVLEHFPPQSPVDEETWNFARSLVNTVMEHAVETDTDIRKHAKNWRLDRMSSIDRNILRIGVAEILYCPDVPPKVAINEAVELAKKYGNSESCSFVNGILDGVLKGRRPA
ncbi:MAG: transcription antitermination factor NusB [Deltaproteobacteria bacterium]